MTACASQEKWGVYFSAGFNTNGDPRPQETVSLEVRAQQVSVKHPPLIYEGYSRSKLGGLISAFIIDIFFFLVKKQYSAVLMVG